MKYYTKIALQHLAMGLIIPIAIIWKLQNGLSVSDAILTESLVLLVTALADLPAGFIANIINNRRSLIIGALLHLIGMILLVIGGSLLVFIIAAVITGIAWAFVSGADEAYLHDDFIEDTKMYKKSYSTVTIVDEASTIFGMILSSLFIYLGSTLQTLFIVSSIILAAHLLYTFFVLPKSKASPITSGSRYFPSFSLSLFKNKKLLSLIPLMLAFAVIYEAARPLWQPHMESIGIDIANFGLLFALLKLASIGGSVLSRFRDFNMRDLLIVFGFMLTSLLLFGSSLQVLSIFALCTYLFTENYFRVYMSTLMNKHISHNRAAILSIASVVRNAAGALIIAGAGLLSSISIMFALTCLVIIKIPAIIYVLRLMHQKVSE